MAQNLGRMMAIQTAKQTIIMTNQKTIMQSQTILIIQAQMVIQIQTITQIQTIIQIQTIQMIKKIMRQMRIQIIITATIITTSLFQTIKQTKRQVAIIQTVRKKITVIMKKINQKKAKMIQR